MSPIDDANKGALAMSDHKHGEMDISVQEKTYNGFIKTGVWTSVVVIIALIFLAIVGI